MLDPDVKRFNSSNRNSIERLDFLVKSGRSSRPYWKSAAVMASGVLRLLDVFESKNSLFV